MIWGCFILSGLVQQHYVPQKGELTACISSSVLLCLEINVVTLHKVIKMMPQLMCAVIKAKDGPVFNIVLASTVLLSQVEKAE